MTLIKDTDEHLIKGVAIDILEPTKFEILEVNEGLKTYLGTEQLAGSNPATVVEFPAGWQIPFSFSKIKLQQGFIFVR